MVSVAGTGMEYPVNSDHESDNESAASDDNYSTTEPTGLSPGDELDDNSDGNFACRFCSKHFTLPRNCLRHERLHHSKKIKQKDFDCSVCKLRFHRQADLRTHMRTHTGEKPYMCETCNKCFARNSDLRAHERRHTDADYHCPKCPLRFLKKSHLREHTCKDAPSRRRAAASAGRGPSNSAPKSVLATTCPEAEAESLVAISPTALPHAAPSPNTKRKRSRKGSRSDSLDPSLSAGKAAPALNASQTEPVMTAAFEQEFHDIIDSVSYNDTSLMIDTGTTGTAVTAGTGNPGLAPPLGISPSAENVIEMQLYLQWSASNPFILLG